MQATTPKKSAGVHMQCELGFHLRFVARSNTANESMVEDYVQSHLAGMPVFRRGKHGHRETLSCFDKTK
jgi:hypothetical protein